MKQLTAVLCLCSPAMGQYLDDLNSLTPIGTDGVSYSWNHQDLGTVIATWTATEVGPSNIYHVSTSERTTGAFGFYDISLADDHANGPASNDLSWKLSWQNPVTEFNFSIGDWDGGTSAGGEFITFAGITQAEITSVGSDVPVGFNYSAPGNNTVVYTNTSPLSGIQNGLVNNGFRVRLTNNDVGFTEFTITAGSPTNATSDFLFIGGPTPVPEPSSALLMISSLGLLMRRGR